MAWGEAEISSGEGWYCWNQQAYMVTHMACVQQF